MPNWITNKVKASRRVIEGMIDDNSNIDFNRIIPFDGEFHWDFVSFNAEQLAEAVTQKPLSNHPLLRPLEQTSRLDISLNKLRDDEFDQFVQMLRNFRKCGVLHHMDFARKHWGTKWNACESKTDMEAGTTSFETAWSCPQPILASLSKKFPDEAIEVQFADEDAGCNCGTFTLKAGEVVASDIAPAWRDQTTEEKSKWRAFACELKGLDLSEYNEAE